MRNKVKESKSCFTSVMERDKKFRKSFYHMPLLKTLDITCFIHVFHLLPRPNLEPVISVMLESKADPEYISPVPFHLDKVLTSISSFVIREMYSSLSY